MPSSVATEIRRRGPTDPTVLAMNDASWLTMIQDPPIPPAILSWDLGMGESAVLAWAYANPGTEAICDDRAARRVARRSAYLCEELSHWYSAQNNED